MDVIDLRPDERGVWVYHGKNFPSKISSQKLETIVSMVVLIPAYPFIELIMTKCALPLFLLFYFIFLAVTALVIHTILVLLRRIELHLSLYS